MPAAIRSLFVIILLYCEPTSPNELFEAHRSQWWDDFNRRYPHASEDQLTALVLQDIQDRLQYAGQSLANFSLPPFQPDLIQDLQPAKCHIGNDHQSSIIFQEETAYDMEEISKFATARRLILTTSQKILFNEIDNIIDNNEGGLFFIDARGGTGKTFVLNTLLPVQRTKKLNQKTVCLAVSTSGIAATLLSLGRTFHSRFNVPLFSDKNRNITFDVKVSPSINQKVLTKYFTSF